VYTPSVTERAPTVSDAVRRWAERAPARVCLTIHAGEGAPEPVTYQELARGAAAYAGHFRAHGLYPGDAVVLFAHTDVGFVAALLGAQDAGLLAVPCPPREPLESARRVGQRVSEILARCRARAVLDPVVGQGEAEVTAAVAESGSMILDPVDPAADKGEPGAKLERGPYAYCQFTSGSGGRAKGVLLTHDNVAANARAMQEALELTPDDACVAWLPLYHDMGLVACVLMPLMVGYPAHLIPPLRFIIRPSSWLDVITRVRGTVTASPNFAFALCARKVSDEERSKLDLSSWRRACNGSEPVTRAAVEAFIARFEPCGFRPSAMLPCYGLAEDTLCVSTRRPGEGARFEELAREALARDGVARPDAGGLVVASVGRPLAGHQLSILDADGQPLADRRVGEIAIHGDSVMHGYLPGTEGEVTLRPDGSLLTGDLGYLADGELVVVGRRKDLIIRAGRNYYPQDLEDAAARVPGVRVGRTVAFSIPTEESERVVMAVEHRREWEGDAEALRGAVREAVFGTVRLSPDEILLVPPNTLPLTSSGKVMRPEARRLYLEGQLSVVRAG
jgi:acyl-CoA synthetase (AMP-forming)/AMP-acid ligase II